MLIHRILKAFLKFLNRGPLKCDQAIHPFHFSEKYPVLGRELYGADKPFVFQDTLHIYQFGIGCKFPDQSGISFLHSPEKAYAISPAYHPGSRLFPVKKLPCNLINGERENPFGRDLTAREAFRLTSSVHISKKYKMLLNYASKTRQKFFESVTSG